MARFNQLLQAGHAKSEAKVVLLTTTFPSLFWKRRLLYSSNLSGNKHASFGWGAEILNHFTSCFTRCEISLSECIFNKVSIETLVYVPREQVMAECFPKLRKSNIVSQLDLEGILVIVLRSVTSFGQFWLRLSTAVETIAGNVVFAKVPLLVV